MNFLGDISFFIVLSLTPGEWNFYFKINFLRERKREREREDLWRKLDDLSLTNAKKEGISLDILNHADFNSTSSSSATSAWSGGGKGKQENQTKIGANSRVKTSKTSTHKWARKRISFKLKRGKFFHFFWSEQRDEFF